MELKKFIKGPHIKSGSVIKWDIIKVPAKITLTQYPPTIHHLRIFKNKSKRNIPEKGISLSDSIQKKKGNYY